MDCSSDMGHSSQDSGCLSMQFDTSASIWVSTPVLTIHKRKRKRFSDMDIVEEPPTTPQFSSTLNESLCLNLKACGLETPDKSSASPARQFCSPARESHDILYSNNIKQNCNVTPKRKILTPRKQQRPAERLSPLETAVQIPIVMDALAAHLSNADLYRLTQCSRRCQSGVMRGFRSRLRCLEFRAQFRGNKENYMITPPCSPKKSPEHQSDSVKFDSFTEVAKLLSPSKSLAPCISCGNPAVADKNIRQCQSVSCGTIHCIMCGSISKTGPENFQDKCGKSTLAYYCGSSSGNANIKYNYHTNHKLDDISNRANTTGNNNESSSSLYYTFHNTYHSHSHDSGISSEGEISPGKVRKNLFSGRRENGGPIKRLFDVNRPAIRPVNHQQDDVTKERSKRKKRHLSYTPVITSDSPKRERITDSPSPPPKNIVAVGSAQSRKNLKRLTR